MGAACILCFSAVASGTRAYFTAEEVTHNTITSGNIKIRLMQWEDKERTKQCASDRIEGLMPGDLVERVMEVENDGDNPAYVRVELEKQIHLAVGMEGTPDPDQILLSLNEEAWTKGEDGYYYYNRPLLPGQVTEPLFYSVLFPEHVGNLYQGSTVSVKVTAYGVQAENNGETVFSALGWPKSGEEDVSQ